MDFSDLLKDFFDLENFLVAQVKMLKHFIFLVPSSKALEKFFCEMEEILLRSTR